MRFYPMDLSELASEPKLAQQTSEDDHTTSQHLRVHVNGWYSVGDGVLT